MTDVRLLRRDQVEIIGGSQVHVGQRVFLIVQAAHVEFSVEPNEDSVVQTVRETRRSERNLVRPFTLLSREWVRQRLKSHQWLNSRSSDDFAGTIFRVVGGKTEELGGLTDFRRRDHIQFISTQRF